MNSCPRCGATLRRIAGATYYCHVMEWAAFIRYCGVVDECDCGYWRVVDHEKNKYKYLQADSPQEA